jgi:hypothetical protein
MRIYRPVRTYFFAFLRAAQYFFIRALTAFRSAAVIFRLRRRTPALRAPLLKMKFSGNSSSSNEALRSGNTLKKLFRLFCQLAAEVTPLFHDVWGNP